MQSKWQWLPNCQNSIWTHGKMQRQLYLTGIIAIMKLIKKSIKLWKQWLVHYAFLKNFRHVLISTFSLVSFSYSILSGDAFLFLVKFLIWTPYCSFSSFFLWKGGRKAVESMVSFARDELCSPGILRVSLTSD